MGRVERAEGENEGGSEMNYSPTPETDKAEDSDPMVEGEWKWIVPSSFARRLERERDAALEELSRVKKELVASNRGAEKNAKVNQGLCAKLAEAERERDEALKERDEARRERDDPR